MDVSVIIVNRNTQSLLIDALAALPEACERLSYEAIVVDNGSTDGSVDEVRRRFPDARLLVNERNFGFAGANNQALHVVQGEFILLLNSDTRAMPGSIATLVQFARIHPRGGIFGPRLLNADGSFQGSSARFPTVGQESLLLLGNLSRRLRGETFPYHPLPPDMAPRSVDWVSGACLLIRRSTADQIGDMDEGYFMYTEETDWCYRARQVGWDVWWVPTPIVFHLNGATAQQTFSLKRRQVYGSKIRFLRKYRGWLHAWAFGAAVWLTSLFKTLAWGGKALIGKTDQRQTARRHVKAYLEVLGVGKA